MKNTLLACAAFALFGIGYATFTTQTATAAVDKAEIRAVVQEYIHNNGGDLLASIDRYETQQAMAKMNDVIYTKGLIQTPIEGPNDAKVTLVEFSEFQCPYCGRVQPTLKKLREKYEGQVRFAFKHFPLDFHKQARAAGAAAQAAEMQKKGNFFIYAEKLWPQMRNLNDKTYTKIARDMDLNMAKWNKDRKSDRMKKFLDQEMLDGVSMGVRGTPHFVINGQAVSGAADFEAFDLMIQNAFKLAE